MPWKGSLRSGFGRLRRSQIAGPGLATLVAIVAGIGATFLGQMMISRHLGVGNYGFYSMLVSVSMLLVLPASIGLDGAIMRFMPIYLAEGTTRHYRRLIQLALVAQIAGVAAMVAALFGAALFGFGTLGWARTSALGWVALLIGATVIGNTAAAILQAARRVIIAQIFLSAVRPSIVAIMVALLFTLRPASYSAIDLFRVTAGATALAVVVLVGYIVRRFFLQRAEHSGALPVRSWMTFGLYNVTAGAGQQALVQLPILIVGTMGGHAEAGYYGVASRLASTVSLGLAALATVSVPLISMAFATKDDHEVRRIARTNVRLSFSFAVLATVAIIIVGRWLLAIFGPGFVGAYPTLVVLMIGLTASSSLGVATAVVAMSGRPAVVAIANAAGVVALVVVACLLVPSMGPIGGALAYAVAILVALGTISTYAYRGLRINTTILAR